MKLKFLLLSILLMFCSNIKAQDEFITIWKPASTGIFPSVSSPTQIYFPGVGTNYKIYWEEVGYPAHNNTLNNVTTLLSAPLLIDFGSPLNPVPANATYTLKVSNGNGNFHRICFYAPNLSIHRDSHKIIDVSQWGKIRWSSMEYAFNFCTAMDVTATDIPILSDLTNMSSMFSMCYELVGNSSFSNWNLLNVTNLSATFYFAKKFNQPISSWDISNVTDISLMFMHSDLFNQPIGNWDTSNVTSMHSTFSAAFAFNQPLANWNTSKVTTMQSLFFDTAAFNQPIGNWDTSKVKDMSFLFSGTEMFNQPIANWDTSKVTDMRYMFNKTFKFNQPIENLNTSNVTDMSGMFAESKLFNQPIQSWDTSKVTDMKSMFSTAEKFNQPIEGLNTSQVTDMSYMFYGTLLFNQPIGNWNTSNVKNMLYMFTNNPIFNQPIGTWDTSAVTDMRHAFKNATAFNQDLGTWNLYSVTQINSMLDFSGLSCNNYNSTLQGWANSPFAPNNLTLGSSGLAYSTPQAVAARNILTGFKGWIITNDIYSVECNVLGTSEVHKTDLNIYPNPVKNTVFFSKELQNIEIYSIDGRLLKRSSKGDSIDISELPKGIYIIKAYDLSGNILSKKIIKD
jgi:surface protein